MSGFMIDAMWRTDMSSQTTALATITALVLFSGTIDAQFQHAVQAAGGQIYRTHGLGYILRRGNAANHTWREPIGTFLRRNRRQWRGFRPNALMELPVETA